jgi:hypothetical protein
VTAEELLARHLARQRRAVARQGAGRGTLAAREEQFLEATRALAVAGSPQLAAGWHGVAQCRRYQKGRRPDTLDAFHCAFAADPQYALAWDDYLEYRTYGAFAADLTELLRRLPVELRWKRVPRLVAAARRTDVWGNVTPDHGALFLAGLTDDLRRVGDDRSLGWWLSDRGVDEKRNGSHARAVEILREAVATGHPSPQAVDRLTVHLTQREQWLEAAAALWRGLELGQPIPSDTLRQRLEARLRPCERKLERPAPRPARRTADSPTAPPDVAPSAPGVCALRFDCGSTGRASRRRGRSRGYGCGRRQRAGRSSGTCSRWPSS